MKEIWKTIWNYPKYQVSNLGRVRYKKTRRIRKLTKSNGYCVVKLYYNGKNVGVHRLVFEAFYRRLLPNEQAHHLNQIRDCNLSTNLVAWDRHRHAEFHSNENRQLIRQVLSKANKGKIPWNKGKKTSQQTKKKKSESMKKYYETHDSPNKGKKFSQQTKAKMSKTRKGRIPWNKGKKQSEETKRKISESINQIWTRRKHKQ